MISERFKGKVVFITGSTDGIGLAIATRFSEEGAIVVVNSRKPEAVEATKLRLNCDGIAGNVSSDKDRSAIVAYIISKYRQLDVLVLNAATSLALGLSEDCDEARWTKMMDTNLKANWLLCNLMVPSMPPTTSSIVFVSSYAGYNPDSPIGIYGVTKTALIGLTRLLANEYGRKYKIRVNAVAPGVIKTKFSKALWESAEVRSISEDNAPLGRVGTPEEVAGPVAFLASRDSSYITGECLVIAGGTHCRF